MVKRVYEGMFLLEANRYSRDPGNVSGKITELIEKAGGETLVSRLWAEQKLAYPINGHRKGVYWLTYFRMESERLKELTRACKLNNDVMRELFVVVDPRLVETLVSHAQNSGQSQKPAETSSVPGEVEPPPDQELADESPSESPTEAAGAGSSS